MTRSQ